MASGDLNLESKNHVREKIRKIFEAAQQQYGHQKLIEKCKKLHKKYENDEIFLNEFTTALKYTFVYQEKLAVDNILSFVSKYVAFSYATSDNFNSLDGTIDESSFVNEILEFVFKSHGVSLADARLRCMHLLSKILSSMPENSLISDEMWSKLKEIVLCRLQDKNSGVRAQAVLTARMLQDPKNANCEVMKALIFHFNDPSPIVRRCVVSSIALNKVTIAHILGRTRDVNDNVRRNAYLIFAKIKPLNLTIKYRVSVLERGLQDRSEMVQKCVEQVVVINWLEYFQKNILKFLDALDVVNCSEIAIKTVESLLKTQPKENIIEHLSLDDQTHLVLKEKISPEIILLWRCLAHYFLKQGNEEELEAILPDLTVLCQYIRGFYKLEESPKVSMNEEEQWAEVKEKEILNHFLEIIKVYDLSDEMGRSKLKELIVDILISPRISNSQIKSLVELLVLVIPTKDAFIQELTEVISEIREPFRTVVTQISNKDKMERDLKISDLKVILNDLREQEYQSVSNKNYSQAQKLKEEIEKLEVELKLLVDQPVTLTQEVSEEKSNPVTLCKCLTILVEMIKFSNFSSLTPNLLNLKENFLNQCMSSRDLLTQSLAIQATAQFCILDKELAKENLIRFLLMVDEEGDNEISIPSLKGIFDIILTHGVECFEQLNQNKENENAKNTSRTKHQVLMSGDRSFHENSLLYNELDECFTEIEVLKNLNTLLYCKNNDDLKSIAYEGLCKLLLSGTIYSPSILTRIIIKGFSPIIDCEAEDFIRQTFMVFFPIFAAKTPKSQEMIEAAFLPTIKALINADLGSPDADINPKDVIVFLIDHTKADINKHTAKTLHVHNNLALSFCHEIYKDLCDPKDKIGHLSYQAQMYLKGLNHFELSFESKSFVDQIRNLLAKIEENFKERTCVRLLWNFIKKIEDKSQTLVSSVENTLMTTEDSQRSKQDSSQQDNFKKGVNSRISVVKESLANSTNDLSSSPGGENVRKRSRKVIPESPDISD